MPLANPVQKKMLCEIPITLADESIVQSSHKGVREVCFLTGTGICRVSSSNTLLVPDAGLSSLSVPSLVQKDIDVLFMPRCAVLLDLQDDMATLGFVEQEKDGLFCTAEHGTTDPSALARKDRDKVTAMMAVINKKYIAAPTVFAARESVEDNK